MEKLEELLTEQINPGTLNLDQLSTANILKAINKEDQSVALAVAGEIPNIAAAVEVIAEKLRADGRLIYIGAGTSGRLGIMDAAECPPTFGFSENQIIGLIAGGYQALLRAIEGAEDNTAEFIDQLQAIHLTANDVVLGLAASGRTPAVTAGLKYAGELGAFTIALSCSPDSQIGRYAQITITPLVGAEVIAGSTRMKAGTAQKMVLNMITTAVAVKLGKVYGNLMVDLQPTNAKLTDRAKRIVAQATGVSREQADQALRITGYNVKLAIVMIKRRCKLKTASQLLTKAGGYVRKAITMEMGSEQ